MKKFAVNLVYVKFKTNDLDDVYSMLEIIKANSEEEALGKKLKESKIELNKSGVNNLVLRTSTVIEIN